MHKGMEEQAKETNKKKSEDMKYEMSETPYTFA